MSDELYFYFILIIIYIIELCKNVGVYEIFILNGVLKNVIIPSKMFLKGNKSLNIFIPAFLSYPFQCEGELFSMCPNGICNVSPQDFPFKVNLFFQHFIFFQWNEISEIKTEGDCILINGKVFVKCISSEEVKLYISLFKSLQQATDKNTREQIINNYYKERCSLKKILKKNEDIKSKINILMVCSFFHFLLIFIIMPVLYFFYQNEILFFLEICVAFLITLFLSLIICLFCFENLVSKILFFTKSLIMFPFLSILVREIFIKNFSSFNACAVLICLNRNKQAYLFTNRLLRNLKYCQLDLFNSDIRECITFSNRLVIRRLLYLLQKVGADKSFHSLTTLPKLQNGVKSYCPKCQSEYIVIHSMCPDCGCRDIIKLNQWGY